VITGVVGGLKTPSIPDGLKHPLLFKEGRGLVAVAPPHA